MILSAKQILTRNLINIPGCRSKKKIVVLESDDWGSIRIPSSEVSKKLFDKQLVNSEDPYARFDCLESNDDMAQLFETLTSIKDCVGNYPVITANTIVANPDFQKIRESNFNEYYFEPFTETLQRYFQHDKVFNFYKSGIEQKIFIPQFHGREHLNVASWMRLLKNNDQRFKLAFDLETYAIDTNLAHLKRNNLLAAFDFYSSEEKENLKKILIDGYQLFTRLFGYHSKSFIAPCYVWDDEMEEQFGRLGVTNIQSTAIQAIPQPFSKKFKHRFHYSGQKNSYGQYYFIRNCFFEPSFHSVTDPVGKAMQSIKIAFAWRKPAVISSHRVNYIGGLDESNRKNNLSLLKNLLINITKEWPNVEFISSANLYNVMMHKV